MATSKVGIYRQYFGPVPTGPDGQPLPQSEWPRKRPSSWLVRWYGTEGKRYSKSFDTQVEAQRFAETKQQEVRGGRSDPPPRITLRDFHKEHKALMQGNLAWNTLRMHLGTIAQLAKAMGWDRTLDRITVRDIEGFRAARLKEGITPSSANKDVMVLRRIFNLAILRGYLPGNHNPCKGLPMLRIAPKRPPYISPAEFESIYSKVDDPCGVPSLLCSTRRGFVEWRR